MAKKAEERPGDAVDRGRIAFRYCLWSIERVTMQKEPREVRVKNPLSYVQCDQPFDAYGLMSFDAQAWSQGKFFSFDLVRLEGARDIKVSDFEVPFPYPGIAYTVFPFSVTMPALPAGTYDIRLWDRCAILRDPRAQRPVCLSHYVFGSLTGEDMRELTGSITRANAEG